MKVPEYSEKLFFGEKSIVSIDRIKFREIVELANNSESNTWFTNEINYTADKTKYKELPKEVQRLFEVNIAYQTTADNDAKSIYAILAHIASVPELEYLYSRINVEELIHTLSYSNGLDLVIGDRTSEVINSCYSDPIISTRMEDEANILEKLFQLVMVEGRKDDETKKILIEAMIRTYLLESVKFPFSFFTTWTINKSFNNPIQGFSQAIKLINHDESNTHVNAWAIILNKLFKDPTQEFLHLKQYYIKLLNSIVAFVGFNKKLDNIIFDLEQNSSKQDLKKLKKTILKILDTIKKDKLSNTN
jgi:ribonucleotide reductase beta subunit family protein with ferritin-like domain